MEKGDNLNENSLQDNIKNFLIDGPASINDVSEKMKVAWATAKVALEDLKQKEELKEIISSKVRIFALANDPASYNIPLTYKQKKEAYFIFSKIQEEWSNQRPNETLLATTLQKIAVDVVSEGKIDLPIVPLHYGLVLPVMYKPDNLSYSEQRDDPNILTLIKKTIPQHTNKAKEEMRKQYEKYDKKLFLSKELFLDTLNGNFNQEKFEKNLTSVFMHWPTKENASDFFKLFHRFIISSYVFRANKVGSEELQEIKETFGALWDGITTYLFFEEAEKFIRSEKKEIFNIIKENQISMKLMAIQERVCFFESITKSLAKQDLEIPQDDLHEQILNVYEESLNGTK